MRPFSHRLVRHNRLLPGTTSLTWFPVMIVSHLGETRSVHLVEWMTCLLTRFIVTMPSICRGWRPQPVPLTLLLDRLPTSVRQLPGPGWSRAPKKTSTRYSKSRCNIQCWWNSPRLRPTAPKRWSRSCAGLPMRPRVSGCWSASISTPSPDWLRVWGLKPFPCSLRSSVVNSPRWLRAPSMSSSFVRSLSRSPRQRRQRAWWGARNR